MESKFKIVPVFLCRFTNFKPVDIAHWKDSLELRHPDCTWLAIAEQDQTQTLRDTDSRIEIECIYPKFLIVNDDMMTKLMETEKKIQDLMEQMGYPNSVMRKTPDEPPF